MTGAFSEWHSIDVPARDCQVAASSTRVYTQALHLDVPIDQQWAFEARDRTRAAPPLASRRCELGGLRHVQPN
eukprot:6514878-Alexandrium_andersonii.AAC.1